MSLTVRNIIYIFILSVVAAACSANDPELPGLNQGDDSAYIKGDSICVSFSLDMPEMPQIDTRALEPDADYNDMHLYILEFADNGSPFVNPLTAVYIPSEENPQSDRVNYKVTLSATDEAKILHLIALPKSQSLDINYGIEASVIPNLEVSGDVPAYWRRLTFPKGYVNVSENGDVSVNNTEIEKLRHVALVRNFLQITMKNAASNFTLSGFSIVNRPARGIIAAWNDESYTFAELLDNNGNMLDYNTISSDYHGVTPPDTELLNTSLGPVVSNDLSPKYMYERPFKTENRTYLLIKGRRNTDSKDSYYKIDLGKNDANAIFSYYNLVRNFSYNITIRSVGVKGYNTIQEAVEGVVYNNLSFDIDLSSMLSISDGNEIVNVNFTTKIFTDKDNTQTIEFKYRYKNISGAGPTFNNDDVNIIGLTTGPVIQKIDYGTKKDDSEGWRTIKITINKASRDYKIQSFTLVKSTGLGRTIKLVLHEKWDMSNFIEFNGQKLNYTASTTSGTASNAAKKALTIFFDLPDELPKEVFPLQFYMEADRQNIENDPDGGDLVVRYGTTMFHNTNGPIIQGDRIKYVKEVTYTDYERAFNASDKTDRGTKIINADGSATHRVRCFFRTTVSLANLGIPVGESTTTKVRIHNDNFNDLDLSFTRKR